MLSGEIRESDIFGRLGGEEFGLILLESDAAGFRCAGERIRQAVAAHVIEQEGKTLQITISTGMVICEESGGLNLEAMMKQADAALYAAKDAGKNQGVVVMLNQREDYPYEPKDDTE